MFKPTVNAGQEKSDYMWTAVNKSLTSLDDVFIRRIINVSRIFSLLFTLYYYFPVEPVFLVAQLLVT